MDVNNLNDCFAKWNPMRTAYMNTEFNQYVSGPGANLQEELQPARQALQKAEDNKAVPTLVFKDLPQQMTLKALRNMCSKHGKVREVRDSTKNSFYFVDMATVGDMEAVFRALENNNYGFKILVGKEKEKNTLNTDRKHNEPNPPKVPPKNTGIDFDSRKYRTSKKNHKRPSVRDDNPFSVSNATISGLSMNLVMNDAHSLERQGLNKLVNNETFSYRNGRSYVNMPEKTKQALDKKHKESTGRYIENEGKYVNFDENNAMPINIKKCSQCYYACDTVCERCSQYYCSAGCQKNDWHEHRYKCGKPTHLQKTPPSKKNIPDGNSLPELPKEEINAHDVENSKERTTHISAANSIKPRAIPRQLLSINKEVAQQKPTSSNSSQQLGSFQKLVENSAYITSQNSCVVSESSSKKLPAALRLCTHQKPNTPAATYAQHQSPSSKSTFEQKPNYPAASQNSCKSSSENSVEVYKQNMPRSGNIVAMTAISKTNVVFIRSTTYEANLSYINTVDTLQVLGKMLHPLKSLPKSGEVVIAKSEGQFNRALVLSVINPGKIFIHFMDFGNIEQGKLEDLFEAPKEFIFKPRHAIPVVLKDVEDVYMTEEIRKFMYTYLNNINLEICYKPEDFRPDSCVYAVELIDETTQQNLNKIIMKLAMPVEPQDTDDVCDRDYLARKLIPGGRNVELIVMDNSLMSSGCISCTIKSYALEIEKFKKDIQAYVESIPADAYTPRIDELCIAQYDEDGLWYRGLCLETVGDGHPSIHFIDYGNITMVPIESIRRYPRQFTYPIYTVDCAIDGLPEFCDDKLVEELEDLIPNGEKIKCENVMVDEENNFCILSMPNVTNRLTELGLI